MIPWPYPYPYPYCGSLGSRRLEHSHLVVYIEYPDYALPSLNNTFISTHI